MMLVPFLMQRSVPNISKLSPAQSVTKLLYGSSVSGSDWFILAIEAERSEKDKIITDLRNSSHASNQLQRDLDLQQAMVGKLQQQLVDEKIKAQNLLADSMAAQKRANQLDQARLEIEEFELKVKKLEKELSHRIEQHG